MASRRILLVSLALVVTALAGCTDSESSYEDLDDTPADEPKGDLLGDLLGQPTGIDVEPLADPTAPGTLEGVVYGLGNGQPIEHANVFVTCLRAELVPGFTQVATTNATGGFELPGRGLADCLQVTYEIQAPGFTLAVPLFSGPIADGTATFVYGGLAAAPQLDALQV